MIFFLWLEKAKIIIMNNNILQKENGNNPIISSARESPFAKYIQSLRYNEKMTYKPDDSV